MATAISTSELAGRLHANAIHLLRKVRREDAGSGLNAPRLSALSVVVFAGPLTLGDLAAAEQVRPPTMSRIVAALEMKRLVTRKKSTTDARLTQIYPTLKGRRLLKQGRERRVRVLAAQLVRLDSAHRQALLEAVKILEEVVRAV
jgi:DNA-binding MarR family transcriptional regulator